jgi:hypothetical protein
MKNLAEFWEANRASILVSLGVGFLFFVLGPIGVWFSGRKIREERLRKAKEMLSDLLEGMLVSQEEIQVSKMSSLVRAVEREIDVRVQGVYGLQCLLEDVMLRFQRSRHLDAQQKNEYASRIHALQVEIDAPDEERGEREQRLIQRPSIKIIEEIKEAQVTGDQEQFDLALAKLEVRLKENESLEPVLGILNIYKDIFRRSRERFEEHPVQFTFFSIAVLALYFYALSRLVVLK